MNLSSFKQLAAVSLVIALSSTVKADDPADEPSVTAITATLEGPSTFMITGGKSSPGLVVSSSLLIQNTLLPALLSDAKPVRLDLVPGSKVIQRVNPFEFGK